MDLDEYHGDEVTHEQSARSNSVCIATVLNAVTKHISGGIEATTEYKWSIDFHDDVRRKLDGCVEVRIIELICSFVSAGDTVERSACWKEISSCVGNACQQGGHPQDLK